MKDNFNVARATGKGKQPWTETEKSCRTGLRSRWKTWFGHINVEMPHSNRHTKKELEMYTWSVGEVRARGVNSETMSIWVVAIIAHRTTRDRLKIDKRRAMRVYYEAFQH